jgi:hypothetical protein
MSAFLRLWHAAPRSTATALTLTGGASAWVASADDPRQAAYSLYACPVRLGRCAAAGAIVLAGEFSATNKYDTLYTSRVCNQDSFMRLLGLQSHAVMRCLHLTCHSSRRPSDGAHTVLCGAADYKWSLRGLEGGALEAELRRCHLRSADRMVRVAGRNGGVYIKAGQHLGQMVGALE